VSGEPGQRPALERVAEVVNGHGRQAGAIAAEHGAVLKARLPAGKVRLRLRARAANGLTRVVSERLGVTPQRLRAVSISVPQRVGRKAHTVTITLRLSARSKLVAAGHHFTVKTKETKLTIPLPKKPAVGLLKVPFKISATNHAVKGTLRGSIWVIRT
jgi:hypothetical protein